jgi:signal-transduction protein with cAMP-binding, CBS, and nucleotidyltransferase domain
MAASERGGPVLGVHTQSIQGLDIVRAAEGMNLDSVGAADVMTRGLIQVNAETSVDSVMQVLTNQRIIRVPVLSGGELVGIVSRGDVLGDTLSEHENPPNFQSASRSSNAILDVVGPCFLESAGMFGLRKSGAPKGIRTPDLHLERVAS